MRRSILSSIAICVPRTNRCKWFSSRAAAMAKNDVIVDTSSGKLRGSLVTSCLGDTYYSFKGIPYAKPPVGSLRFCEPEPIEPWKGVKDAFEHGSKSLQYNLLTKMVEGSEDCLYANVYSKDLRNPRPLPVMVFIHGGAFFMGSGDDDLYGPDFLLTKDLVLVTFNYRLGIYGFLNLEDEIAPGNLGLKDQILLLEWVQKNVSSFGGDPENVTVFGNSAGGVSVHYLSLSPLAKGLFHKAICQSGDALVTWSLLQEPKKPIYKILDNLGFTDREPKAIIDFLRNANPTRLMQELETLLTPQSVIQSYYPFVPSIDSKSKRPVMPVDPLIAAEEGVQVPMITGTTDVEVIFMLDAIHECGLSDIDRNLEQYCNLRLLEVFKEQYNMTIDDLRRFYLKNDEISERNIDTLLEFFNDTNMTESNHRVIEIQVRRSSAPTYCYKFTYDKNLSVVKRFFESPLAEMHMYRGACHEDELSYLFRAKIIESSGVKQLEEGTGADRIMKQMVELWYNFAKTGRPTPATSELIPVLWKPVNDENVLRSLNIGVDLRMQNVLSLRKKYNS